MKRADRLPYAVRRTIAPVLRRMSPDYSTCGRCGVPWNAVSDKTIRMDARGGCFALCQSCWAELRTAEARLPYYLDLIPFWESQRTSTDQREDPILIAEQITHGVIEASERDARIRMIR